MTLKMSLNELNCVFQRLALKKGSILAI